MGVGMLAAYTSSGPDYPITKPDSRFLKLNSFPFSTNTISTRKNNNLKESGMNNGACRKVCRSENKLVLRDFMGFG
eukprot:1161777-Pelagomonas_calceolata.AAC.2